MWVEALTWFGRSTTAAANAVVDDNQRWRPSVLRARRGWVTRGE